MVIDIGFSPCPNDTFIFDALVNKRIDTQGLTFNPVLADVEQLNQWAMQGKLPFTKLSFHAFAYCVDNYALLNTGSALGRGCGPMLISKTAVNTAEITNQTIAIPGKYTTANFLLSVLYPQAKNKIPYLFSDIENVVLTGEVDLGLIIHENRFTYQSKGLHKVTDLGEEWETTTNSPIPLGGIFVNRNVDVELAKQVEILIGKSIEYAFANPTASKDYVKAHSQELADDVIQQHINLYVNTFSQNLGTEGRLAVEKLFAIGWQHGVIPQTNLGLFL